VVTRLREGTETKFRACNVSHLHCPAIANPVLEEAFGNAATADAALQAGAMDRAPTTGDRMTIGSVIGATCFLLLLVGAGAVFGWNNADTIWRWWWAVAIGLIILGTFRPMA
jgi:hypothetical protein